VNAMMQYANIENRVRANYKGSLASKKAKLELEREGVPSRAKKKAGKPGTKEQLKKIEKELREMMKG
jgi:hypothetical protein